MPARTGGTPIERRHPPGPVVTTRPAIAGRVVTTGPKNRRSPELTSTDVRGAQALNRFICAARKRRRLSIHGLTNCLLTFHHRSYLCRTKGDEEC